MTRAPLQCCLQGDQAVCRGNKPRNLISSLIFTLRASADWANRGHDGQAAGEAGVLHSGGRLQAAVRQPPGDQWMCFAPEQSIPIPFCCDSVSKTDLSLLESVRQTSRCTPASRCGSGRCCSQSGTCQRPRSTCPTRLHLAAALQTAALSADAEVAARDASARPSVHSSRCHVAFDSRGCEGQRMARR